MIMSRSNANPAGGFPSTRLAAVTGAVIFSAVSAAAEGPVYFQPFASYPISSYSFEAVVADFDGDGAPDLATPNWYTDNVSILLGNGDGTFQHAVNYAAGGGSPINIEVGFFNGDGRPDLAVVNRGPGGSCASFVSVLLGNGDGTFQGAVTYPIGPCPWEIAVDDLNADLYADLAVVNTADSTVSILLGNGDGTFQGAVNYAASGNSYGIATGDFNADGARDLAVSNLFGPLSILLGNGDGTFQPQVTYPAGAGGHRVTVGLFNSDSRPDLAVFNVFSSDVSILLGNGDGTFQLPIPYALANAPSGNTVADFNGDGKLDIAVTDNPTNTFSVLLGNGDGTFHAGGTFCVGDQPYGIRAGDFNGDGRADVVTSHETGIVSVRLATPVISPFCGTTPPPVLAFGLEHEPLNGANLEFDLDGNLVVTSGGGPGAGDEDVSVHVGDDSTGLSFAPSPDSDLSQLGQKLTTTMRGEVGGVPGTLISTSTIEGTGASALLSVNFAVAGEEGQRARLYDDRNRLIASAIVPNASTFTLTSLTRGSINTTRSNAKGRLAAPGGGVTPLESTNEFSDDLNVTHPSQPGEVWHEVRKIAIQSVARQAQPIRNVDVNFGLKPAGSRLVIQQEAADLRVPGSPKGSASFSTTGLAVITPVPDAVVLTEPPGGGPGLFEIADRGLSGELRRPKKRAEVEMETPPVGPLAEGSYLTTTAHILLKGFPFPPHRYQVAVTEKKVPGPLPVEISADFTDLGSTTHRVTVLNDGVVLGVHSGVGSVIGYAEEFDTSRKVGPAVPLTRKQGEPIRNVDLNIGRPPAGQHMQIGGTTYTTDEIVIEPELPNVTVEAIDDLSLQSQGLGSIIVTSATFEDSALLVGGLPVSLAGTGADLDLDTQDQLALSGSIGGTGQDGYTVDLSVSPPGYATQVPRLPAGGASAARYDLDVTTDTVSVLVSPAGGGGDLLFELITPAPGGTYDLRAYKKGLKIYSSTGRTGVAVTLAGGTGPVPMEQFIEEIEGTTYVVLALSVGAGTGAAIIDGQAIDTDEVQILTAVLSGAAIRKLDYRLSTDRADAVVHADHAVLGPPPGRMPIAALGEGKFERIGGQLALTGLTDSGGDGAEVARAISEKGVQVADVAWQPPALTAPTGSSVTTTGSFAGILDPTTTFAAKKKDTKRSDSRFDVTADFTALGSSTVHVEVLSQGVLVAELAGHGPDIGTAGTAPIGAGAGTVWRLGGEGACVSSTYPAATQFVIDGQTYSGDQLVIGAEGRAAADVLLGLSVTTVGYERLVFGAFGYEPIPVCLADLNDDTFVDFSDYLDFLNLFDAQSLYVDFNQDGFVDFLDYLEFLNLFDAGC